MKNLLIYTTSDKTFGKEGNLLIKIQIDNSLDLGWRPKDLLLITNFDYQYRGIKSWVVEDSLSYDFDRKSNKMPVIDYLLREGRLGQEWYWYHDLDAYENNAINEAELGFGGFDLGLTTYCYKRDWNCGSFFFRKTAKDIFSLIVKTLYERRKRYRADEKALQLLTDTGAIDPSRYKKLNSTYNIQYRDVYFSWRHSQKPLKVLHFHPLAETDYRLPDTLLNTFMYGKNRMGFPLMTKRLIKIFHRHGIQ